MYQLLYHTGIFTQPLAAFATVSKDPSHFHEAIEAVAMHRLENPVNITTAEDLVKTSDVAHRITPSMEVAATLVSQFGALENGQPNVACSPFDVSTFEDPALVGIRNLYNSTVESGYISPVMLMFSEENMGRLENSLVAVLGFGRNPDVDFLIMTINLPEIYENLNVRDTIASGHDMIVFPVMLSLRDLQVENKITIVSSVNGVFTRLFLIKRDDLDVGKLLTDMKQAEAEKKGEAAE